MGDSLPEINVNELTDSVNNAVNGGMQVPVTGATLPSEAAYTSTPPTSFPRVPPFSTSGLPPFPPMPAFPVTVPVSDSPATTIMDPSSSPHARKSSLHTENGSEAHRPGTINDNTMATTATATNSAQVATTSSMNSNSIMPPTSLMPVFLPVSAPGCGPMFVMLSLRLPVPESTMAPGRSEERACAPLPSTSAGPRLPPFPPPFPLLFPILPPPPAPPPPSVQDGRPLRPILPFPEPCPTGSLSSCPDSSLPIPPVSFPQGLPLPPLPPLPPLLQQASVPSTCTQGNFSLPPLLPQSTASDVMHGLPFPPLLPPPPVSLPQNGLPPLLPHPPVASCGLPASLPLPMFPPQSMAAFVQSGLPMTSLSPSSLPPLPSMPPMTDGLPQMPTQPVTTLASSEENCQTSVAYSSFPTSIQSAGLPLSSFPTMTLPPVPPLSSHSDICSSGCAPNCLPPSLPLLPGQFFPPLPFIPGAPTPPDFLSQMPGSMLPHDCSVHHSPHPESCQYCSSFKGSQQNSDQYRPPSRDHCPIASMSQTGRGSVDTSAQSSPRGSVDAGTQSSHSRTTARVSFALPEADKPPSNTHGHHHSDLSTSTRSHRQGDLPTNTHSSHHSDLPASTHSHHLTEGLPINTHGHRHSEDLSNSTHSHPYADPGQASRSTAPSSKLSGLQPSATNETKQIQSEHVPPKAPGPGFQRSATSHLSVSGLGQHDFSQGHSEHRAHHVCHLSGQATSGDRHASSHALKHSISAPSCITRRHSKSQDSSNSNSSKSRTASVLVPSSPAGTGSDPDANYVRLPDASHSAQLRENQSSTLSPPFSSCGQTVLAEPATDTSSELHEELSTMPSYFYSNGEHKTASQEITDRQLAGQSSDQKLAQQMFTLPFHSSSSSQSQSVGSTDSGKNTHTTCTSQSEMEFSASDESLAHLVTVVAGEQSLRGHALTPLQDLDASGVSGDLFSVPTLSVAASQQNGSDVHQDLPDIPVLPDDHHSDDSVLSEQLPSCRSWHDGSCSDKSASNNKDAVLGHSHQPSSQASSGLIPSLSDHQTALPQLDVPVFTTLTESSAHSSQLTSSAAASMELDCVGLSATDSMCQFQNGLSSEFNFAPPDSSHGAIDHEQEAQLPSMGYSPPGLSNQGLSPNMFSSGEMGSADEQQTSSLHTVSSDEAPGLVLPAMSASVLEMLLKEDLQVQRSTSEVETPVSEASTTEMALAETMNQCVPSFTGQFCVDCNKMYETGCQHHNTQYHHVADTPVLTRARASLPACLRLGQSQIMGHFNSTGIFTKERIAAKTGFGPLQGKLEQSSDKTSAGSFTKLKIFYNSGMKVLDISDENECSWLMFLKPARNSLERNIVAFQQGDKIMYVTCRDIEAETELLFWFSKDYCKMLGLGNKRPTATSEYCPYCTVCGTVFYSRIQLRQHTNQQHKDVVARKTYCTTCSSAFQSTAKLNAHECSGGAKLKTHQCTFCDKVFSYSSNLRKHLLLHTGTKKFQCEVCSQTFTQKAHLKSHLITHTGVKNAQCRFCGKQFNRTTDMRQHELQHTKEQTWNCSQCSKTFHRAVLLKRHMKVHNNERNYVCEWCSKAFYTKFHLTRHGRTCKWAKPVSKLQNHHNRHQQPQQQQHQQQTQQQLQHSVSSPTLLVPASSSSSSQASVILASLSDSAVTVPAGQVPVTLGVTITSIQCQS